MALGPIQWDLGTLCLAVKVAGHSHLSLVPKLRMVELQINSRIDLDDMLKLIMEKSTLPLIYLVC
jgi:hypothetical protein